MTYRVLLAVASGLLGAAAFPKLGIWPLAFLSVAGLSIAVSGQRARRGALLGLAYGAGLFLPMLHWTATFVGAVPWLVLVFSQTWYLGLLGAALPVVQRHRFSAVISAALWVAEEALRDRVPFGGFPWGRWAFSQARSPMKWFVALGGAPLVTFAVALVGTLLAAAVLNRESSTLRRGGQLVAAVLVVFLGGSLAYPLRVDPAPKQTATVAAVQGDVPDRGLEFNARRRQVLDNHVAQTLKLAAGIKAGRLARPSLVLWPENASDIDPTTNPDAAAVIQRAVDAVGVPILVGALLDGPGPDHVTNAGVVWMPSTSPAPGAGQRYVKRHPVPFGEYIPLRSVARAVSSKVDLVSHDMVAGNGNGLLTQTPFPVGDVICFEIAYDSLVNSSVRAGAQLLVVQTNNATFGHSAETYQQLAMSQLRAIEHARTVVQVATSGKSAIIGPSGKVLETSGALFTSDVLVQNVPLSTSTTLATRTGSAVEWLLAVVAGGWSDRRRRVHAAGSVAKPKSAPDEAELAAGQPKAEASEQRAEAGEQRAAPGDQRAAPGDQRPAGNQQLAAGDRLPAGKQPVGSGATAVGGTTGEGDG
jgi:apolipoprotein N-acyltransferase